jgi:hypothetical protein
MKHATMPAPAKVFIALVLTAGAAVLAYAAFTWSPASLPSFWAFLALTLFASTLKSRIPGLHGTISPNFAFLLVGMASLSFSEVVVASFAAALVQCVWRPRQRLRLVQVLFSATALPVSCAASFWFSHAAFRLLNPDSPVALVVLAGCIYFSLNSALVSVVIGLVEGRPLKQICSQCYDWLFPYFMGGIIFAAAASGASVPSSAWKSAVNLIPAAVLAHVYFLGRTGRQLALQPSHRGV